MAEGEDEYDELQQAELFDGIRLSWNVFPSTLLGTKKLVVPIGCLYTPLQRNEEGECARVGNGALYCSNSKCDAVCNPFCDVDYAQKLWVCNFCNTRNPFPHAMARTLSQDEPPMELLPDNTTIEYSRSDLDPYYPPVILFAIDTCVEEEEISGLIVTIQNLFATLPEHVAEEVYFGIITFGKHVSLHEIGCQQISKVQSFRGEGAKEDIDELIRQFSKSPDDLRNFFLPLSEAEDVIQDILGNLEQDCWPQRARMRKSRCTGAAIQVGVAVLEALCIGQSARLMVFTGGAPTVGPGNVIEPSLEHHMRSHRDIKNGKAKFYEPALNFYRGVAARAANNSHVVDIFACSLDQLGIFEQRTLVDHTGGVLILTDSFTIKSFSESLQHVFSINQQEELNMCFNGEITCICSPELSIKGCIGPVTSMGQKSVCVASTKATGVGETNKWSMGGLDNSTTLAFYFEVKNTQKGALNGRHGYIQFVTTFRDASGCDITRATTVAGMFRDENSGHGFEEIKAGFDEEAAMALMGRIGVFRAENEFDHNILGWLDTTLIRTITKVADFVPERTETFRLPENFVRYPQYMYYFRRSRFVRVFGYSPDETAFYRHWMLRTCVSDTMTMIQPSLLSFTPDDEPMMVTLDASSRTPDSILLLDTFFHVVKWSGSDVARWRDDKLREEPEYGYIGELLDQGEEEMVERCGTRFPYPTEIRCDEGSSQARFLVAILNPNVKNQQARRLREGDVPPVFTDDVNLQTFVEHLKLKVVTCDI